MLGGGGAGGEGGVRSTGGAFEQRLAHLRASGVVQADEQDARHQPEASWWCGSRISAASAGVTSG